MVEFYWAHGRGLLQPASRVAHEPSRLVSIRLLSFSRRGSFATVTYHYLPTMHRYSAIASSILSRPDGTHAIVVSVAHSGQAL